VCWGLRLSMIDCDVLNSVNDGFKSVTTTYVPFVGTPLVMSSELNNSVDILRYRYSPSYCSDMRSDLT
jgi:hypothetical protein